jgi:hypothetical protein
MAGQQNSRSGHRSKQPAAANQRKGIPMAARKLQPQQPPVNQTEAPAPNLVAHAAAVWAVMGKVSDEQSRRDDIPDGFTGHVDLSIAAQVNGGQVYRQLFSADISVGHKSQRASSTGAPQEDVVAWILGHVNAATRESILRNLPEVYAGNGEQLPVSQKDSEDAKEMLKRLRAKSTQVVRGSVSVKARAAQPPLSLVG